MEEEKYAEELCTTLLNSGCKELSLGQVRPFTSLIAISQTLIIYWATGTSRVLPF